MSEKLKPCPFCGSPAKLSRIISPEGERRGETPSWDVDCTECWVHGRWGSEAGAVAAWNRRADRTGPCCEHMAFDQRQRAQEADALASLRDQGFNLSLQQLAKASSKMKQGAP